MQFYNNIIRLSLGSRESWQFAELLIVLLFCRRLYENNLTGAIPTSLGNLLNLQELKLQKNALSGSIPSSFGNIKTLQFLYILLPKFTDDVLGSQKMHVRVV